MTIHSRSLAVLATAIAALSSVAGASAMTKPHASATSHAKVTKKTTAAARTTKGTTVKPIHAGPAVAAISAFPTGGKGSATEATCALWTKELQTDQDIIDNAPEGDKDDASGPLNQDVDNALDAGCAVIF